MKFKGFICFANDLDHFISDHCDKIKQTSQDLTHLHNLIIIEEHYGEVTIELWIKGSISYVKIKRFKKEKQAHSLPQC